MHNQRGVEVISPLLSGLVFEVRRLTLAPPDFGSSPRLAPSPRMVQPRVLDSGDRTRSWQLRLTKRARTTTGGIY